MTGNCVTCTRKSKAEPMWDAKGGDYWWCEAWPIVPAFTGGHRNGMATKSAANPHWGGPVNLNHFKPESTYAAGLLAMGCPLYADQERA